MGLISSTTRGDDLVSTCAQPLRGEGCAPVVSGRARPGVAEIRAIPWRILTPISHSFWLRSDNLTAGVDSL